MNVNHDALQVGGQGMLSRDRMGVSRGLLTRHMTPSYESIFNDLRAKLRSSTEKISTATPSLERIVTDIQGSFGMHLRSHDNFEPVTYPQHHHR